MATSAITGDISQTIDTLLGQAGEDEAAGAKIGSNLETVEDLLIRSYSIGEDSKGLTDLVAKVKANTPTGGKAEVPETLEGLRQYLQVRYQRAVRAYEAFMTLMRNKAEKISEAIRNLRVS